MFTLGKIAPKDLCVFRRGLEPQLEKNEELILLYDEPNYDVIVVCKGAARIAFIRGFYAGFVCKAATSAAEFEAIKTEVAAIIEN
jgi:hypothetical protein